MILRNTLILFCFFLNTYQSAKILFVSPNLSNSMVMYTGRMADVLVKAGHQVTFFIPETSTFNKLNGTKLAKVVRMHDLGRFFDEVMMSHGDPFEAQSPSFFDHRMEVISQYRVCEEILKRKDELEALKAEKFDLAIADNVDFCDISLIHMLEIPVHIWTTTGPMHEIAAWALGVPSESSYVPATWDNFLSPVMNIGERAYNLLQHYVGRIHALELDFQVTRLFRKYVRPDFPSAAGLAADSAIMFMNGDQFFDPVRPLPSKCINIGGVGLTTPQKLSAYFQEMAMKGKKGFIIFALGTAAPTRAVASWRKKALVDAFARFTDYHFIVKMDSEDFDFENMTRQVDNIDAVSWIPQSDLLAHPRAKLFITHGGYNSIIESGIRGVPMFVLPLFFDQHRNAKAIEYRKLGIALEPSKITEDLVASKLSELLTNPIYQKNADRHSRLFRTKPDQPDETLIKWVDFVLQNGNLPELRPELANMNFIVYNNLDILALLVMCITVCTYLAVLLYRKFSQFRENLLVVKLKYA